MLIFEDITKALSCECLENRSHLTSGLLFLFHLLKLQTIHSGSLSVQKRVMPLTWDGGSTAQVVCVPDSVPRSLLPISKLDLKFPHMARELFVHCKLQVLKFMNYCLLESEANQTWFPGIPGAHEARPAIKNVRWVQTLLWRVLKGNRLDLLFKFFSPSYWEGSCRINPLKKNCHKISHHWLVNGIESVAST